MQIVHCTPAVEELLPTYRIKCCHGNCESSFTNAGNYELHLRKHHKMQPPTRNTNIERLFYCPHKECIYNVARANARHFKSLKYLRQHYQKVHAEKCEVCERCGKRFPTAGQLRAHTQKTCGVKFTCKVCGWNYESMEALLTHGKRKGHAVREEAPSRGTRKVCEIVEQSGIVKVNQHRETQTEVNAAKRLCLSSVQTELPTTITLFLTAPKTHTSVATSPIPCDNETQTTSTRPMACNGETQTSIAAPTTCSSETKATSTPPTPCDSETQTELTASALKAAITGNTDPVLIGPLLPPSTHMYTQTYDDPFTDSLLCFDIQTQTNWSMFSSTEEAAQTSQASEQTYTSNASTCARCAYDELLVSTETQTSFTQCLLDSRNDGADVAEEPVGFGSLYNTQQTQTCEMLLGGLFGSQENDLIGSFQSTYTQT